MLLDDFTDNLTDWYGIGIKCHSQSTNINGRWKGYCIHASQTAEAITDTILGVALTRALKGKGDWRLRDQVTGYRDRIAGYYDKWYSRHREDKGEAYERGVIIALSNPDCKKLRTA